MTHTPTTLREDMTNAKNREEWRDKEFFEKLEEKLDDLFPKGKKPRGEALSLFAFVNIYHTERLTTERAKERGRMVEKINNLSTAYRSDAQDCVLDFKNEVLKALTDES